MSREVYVRLFESVTGRFSGVFARFCAHKGATERVVCDLPNGAAIRITPQGSTMTLGGFSLIHQSSK